MTEQHPPTYTRSGNTSHLVENSGDLWENSRHNPAGCDTIVAGSADHNQSPIVDMTAHLIDSGGRIALKKQQRMMLGDEVVLAYGPRTSTRLFTPKAFFDYKAAVLEALAGHPFDPDWEDAQLQLVDNQVTCKIDGQGRLRIPSSFLKRAGLSNAPGAEVQLVYRSQMGYWEIWPTEDIARPDDPTDPFYRARRLLAEKARAAGAKQPGRDGDN